MRRLLVLGLLLIAAAPAPNNRVRYTVRCVADTRTLYEADIDAPPGTDFSVHLGDRGFTLDATFVNELTDAGVDVRASLATRRRRGELWEEDAQQHRFNVRFDQQIEMLPFGRAGKAGLLKFDIVPARSSGDGPMTINIHDVSNGAITVDAWREPHWYDVEVGNERGRIFTGTEGRVGGVTITPRPVAHGDPWRFVDVSAGRARGVLCRGEWQNVGPARVRVTPEGAPPSECPPPQVSADHLSRLDDAFRFAKTLGPRVWPGFTAEESPIILIDGDHEFLLNSATGAEGFTETPQRFRDKPVYVRARVFPPNLQASFPAIGRATVVIGTPEATKSDPAAWTITVLHELFHVFTFEHGEVEKVAALGIGPMNDARWQLSYPFPYADPRVAAAVRAAALAPSRESLAAIAKLVSPKDYAYLKFVITKEGVARYFENRIGELAGVPQHVASVGPTISRSDFYTLGLRVGLHLDQVSPDWKRHYFDSGVWLDDLLATAR